MFKKRFSGRGGKGSSRHQKGFAQKKVLRRAAFACEPLETRILMTKFGGIDISWTSSAPIPGFNQQTVTFQINELWRRDYPWSFVSTGGSPVVGSIIEDGSINSFDFADGPGMTSDLSGPLPMTVTSVNPAENWISTQIVVTHDYSFTLGQQATYFPRVEGAATLSTLLYGQNDQYYGAVSQVTVGAGAELASPVIEVPPIVPINSSGTGSPIQLPATDPNGQLISYSLTPVAEALNPNIQVPGISVSPSGRLTYNFTPTSGQPLPPGGLAEVEVDVQEINPAATLLPYSASEQFLVDFQSGNPNTPPPQMSASPGTTMYYTPGQQLTFTVSATALGNPASQPLISSMQPFFAPMGMSFSNPLLGTNPATSSITATWTPTAAQSGQDYFVAVIATDSQTSPLESDAFIFLDPTATISTSQQPATATVGSSIADKATVTFGNNPTGTVTFNLYNNPDGTGTPLFTDTEPLVNGTATSAGYTTTSTGTDYWVATYNGDANNGAVTSGTPLEPVTITPPIPSITTSQQPPSAPVGSSIADQATVTGGANPTGTVTFNLYNNGGAFGTPLFTDTENLVNGVATSGSYITTAKGTDFWVVTYNGDSNNSAVTSGTASEPVTITQTTPAINTSQHPASGATVGSSVSDQAIITGGFNPTGTVTFNLYNNPNGTGTPLFTDANEPLLSGTATSAGYTATATGTDYWVATYNGNSNNNTVTSGTALEPVAITPATPVVNTFQHPASATVGDPISDQAIVTAGFNPTGTVTFNLYNNSNGTGTPLFTDTENLIGGIATSAGYFATATGTDYWVATYNGDSNNNPVTNGTASEPVPITPATPAINTSQQPASAQVGSSIADMATVSGGFNPTGTVTFNLYNNPNGTGTPLFTDTEALVNSSATSAGYTATATGTDYWVATYNGDSNNSSVTSTSNAEPVTITTATPMIITQQQPATATVGSSIADIATVFGGFQPTGLVEFNLYNNANGTGTPLFRTIASLDSNGQAAAFYVATATGTDYWVDTYLGDSNNTPVTSPTTAEPVTITPAIPSVNTQPLPGAAMVGDSIEDIATVSGGFNPTGTVTFNLYNGGVAPLFTDTKPLVGGTATSAGYATTAAAIGIDFWVATYNGDSNNSAVTSGTNLEPVTIVRADTIINTQQQPASAVVGSSIADKATVDTVVPFGLNPTGTVTFNLYNNPNGTGTPLFTDTETLVNGSATSAGYTATAAGTDYWVATYNGDSNNNRVTSGTALEPVALTPATPAVNTFQHPANATVGSSISDQAIVTSGFNPAGTVTFNLYNNPNGTGSPLFTDTEPLVGGIATSAGYTATATGTDYWVATYNGDSNNSEVTSGTVLEPVTIAPATPSIITVAGGTVVLGSGAKLTDMAIVFGGVNPTGTITFYLFAPGVTPNANDSNNAYGDVVTVFGNGNYTTATGTNPGGLLPTSSGTYQWVAVYSGDANNNQVTSPFGAEPQTVGAASPSINTSQQPASAVPGSSIADKATVTGLVNASTADTITFNLYGSATVQNSSTLLFTDTETVSLSGATATATSAGYTATMTGTDYWVATFNGDSNNSAVTSAPTAEPVTIMLATPSINTSQQPATSTVGGSIADQATVTGGLNPAGTVTFNLYNNPNGTGTPLFTDTETLVGSQATSKGYTATAAGTDYWVATYNGNSNNSAVTSGTTLEPVVITPATPAIATSQQPPKATVGSSIADKATVTGGFNPTGTVTFNLYNNPNGTGTPLFSDTEVLSSGVAISKGYTSTATGTDYWVATYNGNSNNNAVTSGTALEPVTISPVILLLNTSGQGELNVSGSANLNASDGSIIVDSNNAKAILVSGNGVVQAGAINDSGGDSVSGGGKISKVATGQTPVADPFASLQAPSPSTLQMRSSSTLQISSGNVVLQAGVYVGGINITGNAVVTLKPGTYYFQGGGFTVGNQATVTGQGVLLYNAAGQISLGGSASVTLSPASSGMYAGITIFQAKTNASAINVGDGAHLNLAGIIYAASSVMNISGMAVVNASGDGLIVDDLTMSGGSDLIV